MKHFSIAYFLFSLIHTTFSSAQLVFVDTTFGNAGIVVTDFANKADAAQSLVRQPDGKIVTAGNSWKNNHSVFSLARYHPDGAIDESFGNNGMIMTNIGQYNDAAHALLLQPDGKIVAGGNADEIGYQDFALVRYEIDGTPDATFGTNGVVTTDIGSFYNFISSMVLQPDGKVIAGGCALMTNNMDFALARYNTDGSLDTSFGINGIRTFDIGNGDNDRCKLVLQPDGKILITGPVYHSDHYDFTLARLNADGSLDPAFGNNGKVITDFDSFDDYPWCIALQNDGRIIVAGYTHDSSYDINIGIARYMEDGALDISFGNDGTVNSGITDTTDFAYDMIVEADGSILLTGSSGQGTASNVEVVKYTAEGFLDTDFNGDGIFNIDIPSEVSWASSMLSMDSGKIMLAGGIGSDDEQDYFLMQIIDLKLHAFYTGVDHMATVSMDFTVFPNPCSDILNVRMPSDVTDANYFITISNVLGKQIYSSSESSLESQLPTEISIGSLPQGSYFVTLRTGKAAGKTKLVVKL